ncbi:hypothetical protein D3C73_1388480 [compost metagenome]
MDEVSPDLSGNGSCQEGLPAARGAVEQHAASCRSAEGLEHLGLLEGKDEVHPYFFLERFHSADIREGRFGLLRFHHVAFFPVKGNDLQVASLFVVLALFPVRGQAVVVIRHACSSLCSPAAIDLAS